MNTSSSKEGMSGKRGAKGRVVGASVERGFAGAEERGSYTTGKTGRVGAEGMLSFRSGGYRFELDGVGRVVGFGLVR